MHGFPLKKLIQYQTRHPSHAHTNFAQITNTFNNLEEEETGDGGNTGGGRNLKSGSSRPCWSLSGSSSGSISGDGSISRSIDGRGLASWGGR